MSEKSEENEELRNNFISEKQKMYRFTLNKYYGLTYRFTCPNRGPQANLSEYRHKRKAFA